MKVGKYLYIPGRENSHSDQASGTKSRCHRGGIWTVLLQTNSGSSHRLPTCIAQHQGHQNLSKDRTTFYGITVGAFSVGTGVLPSNSPAFHRTDRTHNHTPLIHFPLDSAQCLPSLNEGKSKARTTMSFATTLTCHSETQKRNPSLGSVHMRRTYGS